ncbi:hypothetical protein ON010_g2976 [Phytophthora cinnamomi]|nr:hypothetical protein ON010_g2976 [Phytophthora cinnamomi]
MEHAVAQRGSGHDHDQEGRAPPHEADAGAAAALASGRVGAPPTVGQDQAAARDGGAAAAAAGARVLVAGRPGHAAPTGAHRPARRQAGAGAGRLYSSTRQARGCARRLVLRRLHGHHGVRAPADQRQRRRRPQVLGRADLQHARRAHRVGGAFLPPFVLVMWTDGGFTMCLYERTGVRVVMSVGTAGASNRQAQHQVEGLENLLGATNIRRIAFPRDRKRDSFFGGMRKKSLQDLKEQQLALYVEQVFQMPEISMEPVLVGKVKQFLGFDSFFEIVSSSSGEDDDNEDNNEAPVASTSADSLTAPHESKLAETVETSVVSEPPISEEHQNVGQPAAEPLSNESHAPSSQYSSTESSSTSPAFLRRSSSAALEDEGEEFVEVVPETDPKAAKKLHKKIIQTVRELVSYDEERVHDFQDQTKDFGREKTSAMEYCAFLLGAVGAQECCKLIPEMARLLPDAVKRDELMQARAAIWRRTHRRNRRRSKQFSESVVMQKQKEEQQQVENVHTRMRPKSDSLSALNWGSERVQPLQTPGRNSMVERPTPIIDEFHSQPESTPPSVPPHRAGLADPRRHLNRRASFNTMFGETLQTDPIKEENPAENESDYSDDSLLDHPRTVSKEIPSVDRTSLQNGSTWTRPSDLGRRNSSFLDEDDDDSTEEDEDNHVSSRSRRSRHSRHRQQSGSGSGSLEKGSVKERPSSRGSLTRTRSRQSSSFIEESDGERSGGEEENSHTRFRRSQRRASRKFDEEAKSGLAPEEENPVLARLKKQGAVNFMMQLR